MSCSGRAGLTIIGVTLLMVFTVALGMLLFWVAAGWFQGSLLDLTEETDKGVQLLRSILVVESADLLPESGEITLVARNIGKVDLVVTRLELRSLSGEPCSSIPETGFANLTQIPISQNASLSIPCCDGDEPLLLRIWYIPLQLFNPEDPEVSIDEMLRAELILRGGRIVPPPACPLPQDWILLDFMDPVAYVNSGKIAWDNIRFRAPLASELENVRVSMTVSELPSGKTRSGSGVIKSMNNGIQMINAHAKGLQIPVRITLTAEEGDWTVIQEEWIFDGIPYKAHVSDISLIWDERERMVDTVLIALGVGREGTYRVTVTLRDCNDEIISTGSNVVEVIKGSQDTWVEVDPVRLDQIYVVETEVEEA